MRNMSDSLAIPVSRLPKRPKTEESIPDALPIRLFTVRIVSLSAGKWNTLNVQSPFWRFYQNHDDGAFVMRDGKRLDFMAGHVYLIPAGVTFSCGNTCDVRHFYIHFDLAGLSRLTMQSLFSGPVALPVDVAFSQNVETFAKEVAVQPRIDLAATCRAKSLIYEGIARFLYALPTEERELAQATTLAREAIAPALLYMEAHLHEPLTIPHLARLCYLSPDYFARRFAATTGQSPIAYLRTLRVQRAAQRLLFTSDSIEQIADHCGFPNRQYFTRVFTSVLGLPPATYRRGRRDGG